MRLDKAVDIFKNSRNEYGHIDLVNFYQTMYVSTDAGINYLQNASALHPITSRQVAAIAVANAAAIDLAQTKTEI